MILHPVSVLYGITAPGGSTLIGDLVFWHSVSVMSFCFEALSAGIKSAMTDTDADETVQSALIDTL
jgi:hypothetical protein